ncbi:helix-turn-helix domain-containing protein, partial [Clostridium sp.]|uniref:helix-turn-helix domain-containing protein n=1 Tax=Clostridium sp. TaxID=1506 RepID=UPI003464092D
MLKAYKTEIFPAEQQKQKINQSIGVCRWLYNQYLAKSQELYRQFKDGLISKKEGKLSANIFDKYINNEV